MEAVSLLKFAVAKSGRLSPLKSPMLRALGPAPVVKRSLLAKVVAPAALVLSRMEAKLLP